MAAVDVFKGATDGEAADWGGDGTTNVVVDADDWGKCWGGSMEYDSEGVVGAGDGSGCTGSGEILKDNPEECGRAGDSCGCC